MAGDSGLSRTAEKGKTKDTADGERKLEDAKKAKAPLVNGKKEEEEGLFRSHVPSPVAFD